MEKEPLEGSDLHLPVLKEEVLRYLEPARGDIFVDATLGGGGHSREILDRVLPGGKLIAIDRDPEAIKRAGIIFERNKENVILVTGNFSDIKSILSDNSVKEIDGVIFDLGLSSYQIDEASRGFSFLREGPLDMRFDKNAAVSAFEVVNHYPGDMIEQMIREYGEERHSKKIAGAIMASRKIKPIETTSDLARIIERTAGRWYSGQKLHPACRTFQGIRIFVNNELESLKQALDGAISVIRRGKRLCVISFHSLEDRIVKNVFKKESKIGAFRILTKKPVLPSNAEKANNPRSRSAKMRVVERII